MHFLLHIAPQDADTNQTCLDIAAQESDLHVCTCRWHDVTPTVIGLLYVHVLNVFMDVMWNCFSKVALLELCKL